MNQKSINSRSNDKSISINSDLGEDNELLKGKSSVYISYGVQWIPFIKYTLSQALKHQKPEHVLQAMMKEEDYLPSRNLLATIKYQAYYCVKMGFAGSQMPWIYVIPFESTKPDLTRRNIIAIS